MSKLILYEELTSPELVAFPRDTPVILPMGNGYDFQKIVSALGDPENIIYLPPFPFGWIYSGLEVSDRFIVKYISNLLSSLHDDGFRRVFALTPQGVSLDLGCEQITISQSSQWDKLNAIPSDSERKKVVIIPIGHTEQHSHHLAMATDTIIVDAIAKGTALEAVELCTTIPVMPYGVSTHRSSFGGTLNAGGRAFEDFWIDVIKVLVQRGFDRFYFINGHGGNTSYLVNVVKNVGEKYRRIFCATSYLYLSGPKGIASIEKHRESEIGGMGHACELETSLMLHLRPELVHMDKVRDDTDFISTPSYFMDWIEGGTLIANPPWEDDTIHGSYGSGSLGTKEKGKIWLEAAIHEKVTHVEEIHEQQNRREARRNSGFGLWGNKKTGS
jgi:creatinine amidohydrolase